MLVLDKGRVLFWTSSVWRWGCIVGARFDESLSGFGRGCRAWIRSSSGVKLDLEEDAEAIQSASQDFVKYTWSMHRGRSIAHYAADSSRSEVGDLQRRESLVLKAFATFACSRF